VGPSSVLYPGGVTLSGQLTNDSVGGVAGRLLYIQRRAPGLKWRTFKQVKTGDDGSYGVTFVPVETWTYRAVWTGVVTSARRTVIVK
jgi:hypothetical protein